MNVLPSLNRWISLGILLILSILLGALAFFTWDKPPIPAESVTWSENAHWLVAPKPSYRLYARYRFNLPDLPELGWLRLSADNDYILYVNGKIVAQEISIPRNTAGLGARRSEPYQNINDSNTYRWLIPDWIQIAHARDWKLTTYIDLTQYLQPGENVIALEVQDSKKAARAVVEGAIYPTRDAKSISVTTGEVPWRLSTQRQNRKQFFWFEPEFPDYDWIESQGAGQVRETTYSRVGARLFQRPLQGAWITANQSNQGEMWLRGSWRLPSYYQRAFIRFAGDQQYGLMINGHLLEHYSSGDGNQLHLYEVTKLLHPGVNTLAVHLTHFWNADWSRQHQRTLSPNGILRFYLDGWAEAQGGVITEMSTDATWDALVTPVPHWTTGAGQGSPATPLRAPEPTAFYRTYEGDAYLLNYPDFLLELAGWVGAAMLAIFSGAWGLGQIKQKVTTPPENQWQIGATSALPATLFLLSIGLLKHRYAGAEAGIWFAQAGCNAIILTSTIEIGLLTCLITLWRRHCIGSRLLWLLIGLIGCSWISLTSIPVFWIGGMAVMGIVITPLIDVNKVHLALKALYQQLRYRIYSYGSNQQNWLLGLVLAVGLFLRVYHLGYDNPEPDENVSWDAVRGILRTGAPEASSGIWYTRSPVYHYLLAIWLRILGDSLVNARLFSVMVGIATLLLVFYFARHLTGNAWLALFITAILAIDPWELWYSRNIRFYQIAQFFSIAAFWAFLEGFINRRARFYQHLFFVLITLTLLSQEVTLLLLPGFFIAFLFYYKPFKLSEDWPILLGSFLTMAVFAFNIYFVKIKSLTPLVGLSSYTTSFIKLQFNNMSIFATNFFVGVNQMYTIYSALFILSFIYFIFRQERQLVVLFLGIFSNIAIITVMVYLKAARYTYPTYPIFLLLAIYGAFCIANDVGIYIDRYVQKGVVWKPILIGGVAALLLLNLEPVRVLNSYSESIRPRHTDISEYIRDSRQPGDVVISNVPAGHANTLGGTDYYLMHRMSFFDAVYRHEGRVIDRWEGGVLLTNVDQLTKILEQSDRVWLHMFDRQLPKDPELARFFNYLQSLGKPVLDTYGAQLKLWTKDDGSLQRMPNKGGNFGPY